MFVKQSHLWVDLSVSGCSRLQRQAGYRVLSGCVILACVHAGLSLNTHGWLQHVGPVFEHMSVAVATSFFMFSKKESAENNFLQRSAHKIEHTWLQHATCSSRLPCNVEIQNEN